MLEGPQELGEHHLPINYTTLCDPRLNYLQGMEMSFLLADLLRLRKTQAFLPHMFNPYGFTAHMPFHSPPSQNLEDHEKTEQAIVAQTEALSIFDRINRSRREVRRTMRRSSPERGGGFRTACTCTHTMREERKEIRYRRI